METKAVLITGILLISLTLDFYIYLALKGKKFRLNPLQNKWAQICFWIISLFSYSFPVVAFSILESNEIRKFALMALVMFTASKMGLVPWLMLDDLRRLGISIFKKLTKNTANTIPAKVPSEEIERGEKKISRSDFLMQAGILTAAVPLSAMTFGIVSKSVYDYRVINQKLILPNLPKSFEGLKIAQISDIHAGSFYDKKAVQGGVDLLLLQKPDLVFFTGDLVNEETDEINDYIDVFSQVKAPMGVFSILGNHDYGDYRIWNSEEEKQQNFLNMIKAHQTLGWNLLLNEHHLLKSEDGTIAIIGVENWRRNGGLQHQDIWDAMAGTKDAKVKLLLSHDPSHWKMQITKQVKDIDVMFAGHTHGMQFGIRTKEFQWSPIQYRYAEWAGLYQENNQQLYVNVGFGFHGYPGRVGILPEITIFELSRG